MSECPNVRTRSIGEFFWRTGSSLIGLLFGLENFSVIELSIGFFLFVVSGPWHSGTVTQQFPISLPIYVSYYLSFLLLTTYLLTYLLNRVFTVAP